MKTTLPTSASTPTNTVKKDPFKRLSLAVKKLDQLINRAHQLGSFSDQLLRDDQTGPRLPSSGTTPPTPSPTLPMTKLKIPRKLFEEDKKF